MIACSREGICTHLGQYIRHNEDKVSLPLAMRRLVTQPFKLTPFSQTITMVFIGYRGILQYPAPSSTPQHPRHLIHPYQTRVQPRLRSNHHDAYETHLHTTGRPYPRPDPLRSNPRSRRDNRRTMVSTPNAPPTLFTHPRAPHSHPRPPSL